MLPLINNFYTIKRISNTDQKIEAGIILNPNHQIYQGHFPQIPVVPGVCQMQIVKEILSDSLRLELILLTADNMKFMAVINPTIQSSLTVKIEYKITDTGDIRINSNISGETLTYFKFSGNFKKVSLNY